MTHQLVEMNDTSLDMISGGRRRHQNCHERHNGSKPKGGGGGGGGFFMSFNPTFIINVSIIQLIGNTIYGNVGINVGQAGGV